MERSRSAYDLEYFLRNRANGLDLLHFGDWQQRYARWIADAFDLRGRIVLDAGCACGGILKGFIEEGVNAFGIDCSEDLIQLGRNKWPAIASRLKVADLANIHIIAENAFHWIHCSMVAEHWQPRLVAPILLELQRVLKPSGQFFCLYESENGCLFGDRNPTDEPSHLCLKPESWWTERLQETGWIDESASYQHALAAHPSSMLTDYRWSWFVARKP